MAIDTKKIDIPGKWEGKSGDHLEILESINKKIHEHEPQKAPLQHMIAKTTATNPSMHSWLAEQIETAGLNARAPISGLEVQKVLPTVKTSNAIQIFTNEMGLADIMLKAKTVNGQSPQARIMKKLINQHKIDREAAYFGHLRATDPKDIKTDKGVFAPYVEMTTDTSVAYQASLFNILAKGEKNFTAGGKSFKKRGNVLAFDKTQDWKGDDTPLTYELFLDFLQYITENSNEPVPTIITSYSLKRRINSFASRHIANETKLNVYTTEMVGDFGSARFIIHPLLNKVNSLDGVMLGGNFDYVHDAIYMPTKISQVKTELTANFQRITTASTLEVTNPDALAIAVGLC